MSPSVVRPEVAVFVAQVRGYLSDLSPDEVEELADGLEADLDERVADTLPGSGSVDLGDPAAYAAELRAAAGLPPRRSAVLLARPGLRARLRARWQPFADAVARQSWWPQFRDSVAALRPVWWLLRAWVAFQVVTVGAGSPGGPGQLLMLLAFVAVSVALGRGLLDARLGLPGRGWVRRTLVGLNVFAVLVLPFAIVLDRVGGPYIEEVAVQPGLVLDGIPVGNVFAYDVEGNPIPVVQLYDQDGRAIAVGRSEGVDETGRMVYQDEWGDPVAPWVDARGQVRWNVFPLPRVAYPEPSRGPDGMPTDTADPSVSSPSAPVASVPSVAGVYGIPDSGVPSASPGASPSASQNVSPSPTPTASSSPAQSPAGSLAPPG